MYIVHDCAADLCQSEQPRVFILCTLCTLACTQRTVEREPPRKAHCRLDLSAKDTAQFKVQNKFLKTSEERATSLQRTNQPLFSESHHFIGNSTVKSPSPLS